MGETLRWTAREGGYRLKARKKITGTAAVSAAALAALAGGGTAKADTVCIPGVTCFPEQTFTQPGLSNAFSKHAELQFPGNTLNAFSKVGGQDAFSKIAELGFPGGTENVFAKEK